MNIWNHGNALELSLAHELRLKDGLDPKSREDDKKREDWIIQSEFERVGGSIFLSGLMNMNELNRNLREYSGGGLDLIFKIKIEI